MKTRKWLIVSGIVILAALAMLALAAGLTLAQEPGPEGEAQPQDETGVTAPEALLDDIVPIQGRLTDAGGSPINGARTITFSLYSAYTGGTALCQDGDSVRVDNGLFNAEMDYCTSGDIDGRQLWLGVQVAGDAEMTPRQGVYAVPYAWSLRPGALISATQDGILTVRSTGTGDADAFLAYAGDDGEAVSGHSPNGIGVWAQSDTFVAVQAYSHNNADPYPAIFGCSAVSNTTCDAYRDNNAAGVMGYSERDFGGYFVSGNTAAGGVYAESDGGSGNATLYLVQRNGGGNFVVGADAYLGNRYWRVDRTGKGFFNGGTQNSGADFAEQMAVEGEEAAYEPGDVLVISASADRMVELSTEPFATTVIGVYSTEPAVLAGAPDTDDPLEGIPVAITGIAPCKVSAENGPIQRGDLLVTSSTPGHAMKAGPNPPQGTVLGKALGELEEGSGVIYVLVTLQ